MADPQTLPTAPPPSRGLLYRLASPWVAIAWLVAIFIHETIGSAFYPVRQAFEVTEMEWFNGPFSAALWGGLCLTLLLASAVRVPWTRARIGGHLTHAGVILLVIACTIYFGNKVEGETLVTRHVIEVTDRAGNRAHLLPNPGFAATLGDATARVQSIIPKWSVLTPDGKPDQAWAVMVTLQFPGGRAFSATLIEDRPELTQYTCEGRIPQSYLPDVQAVTAADGAVKALGLDGAVRVTAKCEEGASATAGDWSLEITGVTTDWPLLAPGYEGRKGTMVAFTQRTPAGQQNGSTIIGHPDLTRYQRARLKQKPDERLAAIALVPAPQTRAYHQDRFALWVRPLTADSQVRTYDVLPLPGLPRYRERGAAVGGAPLDILAGPAHGATFTVTGFAPYAVPTAPIHEDPAAPVDPTLHVTFSDGQSEPLDRQLKPTAAFTELDSLPLSWFRCTDQANLDALLAELARRYPTGGNVPSRPDAMDVRMVFASLPGNRVELVVAEPNRGVARYPLVIGNPQTVSVANQSVAVNIGGIFERPHQQLLPVPVPVEHRQSRMSMGMNQSWVLVEARAPGGATTQGWVAFSPFPHLPEDIGERGTALGGYAPRPMVLDLAGVGRFEVVFSRVGFDLPGPVWMTGFHVPRRPGSNDPMEFFCDLAYGDATSPGRATVHMNNPLEWDGTFFFQASWDPQTEALSVLGIGNRPAGWFMLLASILLGVGMTWSGVAGAMRKGER